MSDASDVEVDEKAESSAADRNANPEDGGESSAAAAPDGGEGDDPLLDLDLVKAVDREEFEADVLQKVDRAVRERERERDVRVRVKELGEACKALERAREALRRTRQAVRAVCSEQRASQVNVRRATNLLREQEEAVAKEKELVGERDALIQELKGLGHDVESDPALANLIPKARPKSKTDGEEGETGGQKSVVQENSQQEETELERSIRLGERTAFGKSLKSKTDGDRGEQFRDYLKDQRELNQANASTNRKSRRPTARKRKIKRSERAAREDDSDVVGNGTDDSDWDSDSDDERRARQRKRGRTVDDGDKEEYLERLQQWQDEREAEGGTAEADNRHEQLEGGLQVPSRIWERLYGYQRVCVQWLWELHQQRVGGILGDEMGLGKTIQVIAFAASMSYSCKRLAGGARRFGPTLIVCPTTVMHQWVQEFHTWWPILRVAVLHDSGSHKGSRTSLIRSIAASRGILVTSYNSLVTYKDVLVEQDFQYVILDEGHKIRNPDAQVTLAAKSFHTPHRIILSGSPLQNNLKELWSLFDFIYPGKLGTLPVFMQQFSVPITQGGYSNATRIQVATAYKCATVLRDTINPYLLRRMKSDVKQHINLPQKNEQILFCRLTDEQRDIYRHYLDSGEIKSIMDGRLQIFVGLINLRKICNHPDLFDGGPRHYGSNNPDDLPPSEEYGHWKRSGKMVVVHSLLKLWRKQGHRVLLFTQSKQMLRILERYVREQAYSYLKLDGTTAVGSRQPLIARFNESPDIFVFLLTTKVGGLGVNLTGASRVVIFDPDWNPSTDTQARERAWRIGQDKQVTIYRLMTAGTIEEKIYHRQIFKQFLVNRVLKDPKQKRFFKSNDLYELFTLNEGTSEKTETSAIFAGTGSEVVVNKRKKSKQRDRQEEEDREIRAQRTSAVKPSKRGGASSSDVKASLDKLLHRGEEPQPGTSTASSSESAERRRLMEKARSISRKIASQAKDRRGGKDRAKERKKKRDKRLDGVRISNLVKRRDFKGDADKEGEDPAEKEKCAEEQDSYVLSKLFKKSGVHSAVQHDVIVEGEGEDYVLIEGEAERVAREAVESLRRSRRECFRAEAGVPTWTGNSGALARPKFGSKAKKKRGTDRDAMSSGTPSKDGKFDGRVAGDRKMHSADDLLARMKNRNRYLGGPAEDGEDSLPGPSGGAGSASKQEHLELLADLRNFVAFQARRDGQASTAELIERFSSRVPPKGSPLFKSLLNEICDFQKRDKGDGLWRLKSEFA